MTGLKVFVDTAPIIYFVEHHRHYFERTSLFLADAIRQNAKLITSVLTTAEVEIKPRKLDRKDIVLKFEKNIKSIFEVYPVTWNMAQRSAALRAQYSSLRAIDSLQIACALEHKCDQFFTNDKRLRSIKEIPIILINDL